MSRLRYLSVCSGIEAASVAWQPLGWQPVAFSEIEPAPCRLLAHHYPDVPNLGDMTKFQEWPSSDELAIDLLCGGTPCQSFSVAGLRKGLGDPRGNLMLTYLAIADRYRPTWLVWENVPGVLSSNGGRDFGTFLGGLGQLGYGFAYRILDAQYFGVAQRRRRVFVVGHLGDWRRAAAVLFERHSLQGHPAPRRETGQGFASSTAPSLTASGRGVERCGESRGQDPVVAVPAIVGQAMSAKWAKGTAGPAGPAGDEHHNLIAVPDVTHALRGEGFDASEDGTGRGTPLVPVGVTIHGTDPTVQKVASYDELAQCLRARTPGNIDNSSTTVVQQPVAYGIRTANTSSNGWGIQEECTHTLDCAQGVAVAQPVAFHPTQDPISSTDGSTHALGCGSTGGQAMRVRRLTPVECEKLQGFEPGYTAIPWRGKPASECPDGPRYRALGNSWAVPCARWIGERINLVNQIPAEHSEAP